MRVDALADVGAWAGYRRVGGGGRREEGGWSVFTQETR